MTDRNETSSTDEQDPLPESNWFWRRAFSIVATLVVFAILIGLAIAANRIVDSVVTRIDTMSAEAVSVITVRALVAIEEMFRMMFYALLTVVTYYMVAPSAEQITKILQTARLLRAGVQVASRSVETPGRKEDARTVGRPPQPVTPEIDGPDSEKTGGKGVRSDDSDLSGRVVAKNGSSRSSGPPDDMPDITA